MSIIDDKTVNLNSLFMEIMLNIKVSHHVVISHSELLYDFTTIGKLSDTLKYSVLNFRPISHSTEYDAAKKY